MDLRPATPTAGLEVSESHAGERDPAPAVQGGLLAAAACRSTLAKRAAIGDSSSPARQITPTGCNGGLAMVGA